LGRQPPCDPHCKWSGPCVLRRCQRVYGGPTPILPDTAWYIEQTAACQRLLHGLLTDFGVLGLNRRRDWSKMTSVSRCCGASHAKTTLEPVAARSLALVVSWDDPIKTGPVVSTPKQEKPARKKGEYSGRKGTPRTPAQKKNLFRQINPRKNPGVR